MVLHEVLVPERDAGTHSMKATARDVEEKGRGMCSTASGRDRSEALFGSANGREYRERVRSQYSSAKGALLTVSGFLSGHESMAESYFKRGAIDVRNARRILDVGCGMGRFVRRALQYAPPDATLVAADLSWAMLERVRLRVRDPRLRFAVADVTRLPFASESFDRVICAWVLEHLPQPELGLAELKRVLCPDGKLYVLVTEATVPGRISAWLWNCFPQRRDRFLGLCEQVGLACNSELWWTPVHRWLRLGGICLELHRK